MTSSDVPDRLSFRCADADRQLVADVLNTAYAEGRLTLEEHSERIDQVWRSKTFGDLAVLTDDLTGPVPVVQYQSSTQPAPGAAVSRPNGAIVVPSNLPGETLWAVMSTTRREGFWTMPEHLTVQAHMGEVILDLTQGGVMSAHTCHVNATLIMGTLTLKVPDGVQVVLRASGFMADQKTSGTRPVSPDAPTIIVTGLTVMSEVKALGPDHKSFAQKLGITQ